MNLAKMIEQQATTMNRAAGYTAAQYQERIDRLVQILRIGYALMPMSSQDRVEWVRDASAVLSTEHAHTMADAAGLTCTHHDESYDCGSCVGESDLERARRTT